MKEQKTRIILIAMIIISVLISITISLIIYLDKNLYVTFQGNEQKIFSSSFVKSILTTCLISGLVRIYMVVKMTDSVMKNKEFKIPLIKYILFWVMLIMIIYNIYTFLINYHTYISNSIHNEIFIPILILMIISLLLMIYRIVVYSNIFITKVLKDEKTKRINGR